MIMAGVQMCAAFISYLGGYLGTRAMVRLYGSGMPGPSATEACARAGLWLLLVPPVWATIILVRTQREAPTWELIFWFVLAVVFSLFVGGCGIIAAIGSLVVV